MSEEIGVIIQRVRRGTRNVNILAICDEVERLQRDGRAEFSKENEALKRENERLQAEVKALQPKTADKATYQREYMRQYRKGILKRAKKKARRR